jgi:hypothetical protein
MSETHDLLPIGWGLDVPDGVRGILLDLGIACNEAALAVNQAHLLYRCSVHGCETAEAAEACGEAARHRRQYARQWFDCTVSYVDQLTAVYTTTAAKFAGYAARLGTVLAARGRFPAVPPDPAPIRPSHVLGAPDSLVPLVQLPAGRAGGGRIVTHNGELAAQHRRVLEMIDVTVGSHPIDVYDDPARVANRPAETVGLGVDLADALHGYAAACVWGIGLATRTGAGTPSGGAADRRPAAENHDQLAG